MKKIMTILGLIMALSATVGVLANLDSRWAKASTVSLIAERLDQKIIQDRMDKIQERMWQIEDRWTNRFWEEHLKLPESIEELLAYMSKDARDMYRELQREIEKLEKQLEDMQKEED